MSDERDPFGLQRFAEAQSDSYERARSELRQGEKQSHWMWFVFPQMRGLGRSPMAHRYGIASMAEARAYLAHPVLGPRLADCVALALDAKKNSASEIFPYPDDLKFHSSMTLFAEAAGPAPSVFSAALEKFWRGERDPETLRLLGAR
ncbi:MAG: DUF1810 domain-containing protein [Rhodomicrobium sp.]|jgi:uncharacterized protein (DUF1810 family)